MSKIDEINLGLKNAKKWYTGDSIMGRPLAQFKQVRNPAFFTTKGLVVMLFGYDEGRTVEFVGIKPDDPGFVLCSGLVKCDYVYACKCAGGWKGKKLCILPLQDRMHHVVIGDYDRANKCFREVEYKFVVQQTLPAEGLVYYTKFQKQVQELRSKHDSVIGMCLKGFPSGEKHSMSIEELLAKLFAQGEMDGEKAAEAELRKRAKAAEEKAAEAKAAEAELRKRAKAAEAEAAEKKAVKAEAAEVRAAEAKAAEAKAAEMKAELHATFNVESGRWVQWYVKPDTESGGFNITDQETILAYLPENVLEMITSPPNAMDTKNSLSLKHGVFLSDPCYDNLLVAYSSMGENPAGPVAEIIAKYMKK
jgi:hypothetical protein